MSSVPKGPQNNQHDQEAQEDTNVNEEKVYETTYDVIDEVERNEGERETTGGEESSIYMSLKDNKEPANVYQVLQPPGTNDDHCLTMEGDHSMEYQNLVFSVNLSGD